MPRIEYLHPATEKSSASLETIEVRVWDRAGTDHQRFYIGSGLNFQASGNIWVEIIYSVEGAQIFYTRTFLHQLDDPEPLELNNRLDDIAQKGEGNFIIGGMLPETSFLLSVKRSVYPNGNGEEKTYIQSDLVLSVDTGAVFGFSGPGQRYVEIKIPFIELEDGIRFMRELVADLDAVFQGKHPNPALLPLNSSEWPFVYQLNRRAYNLIASTYREEYFENPSLSSAFDHWLAELPSCGEILDSGCGHGDPVIGKLVQKGFQVTGSDFSSEMLARARQRFPQASFVQLATTQLNFENAFDGACSFSSMLYLDPIDFYHAIYRLYCALKPGGLLFLYAYDPGPDWRGEPYHTVIGQWMWSWHYGMEEASHRLEEHGYFDVLFMEKVEVDPGEEQRIALALEIEKQRKVEYEQHQAENPGQFIMPFFPDPPERSPYGYVIQARRKNG